MKPPVIAIRWVLPLYAGIGLAILALSVSAGLPDKSLVAWAIWGLCGVILIAPLSVRLTDAGVSALSWRGRKFLAWEGVEEVQCQSHVITLIGQSVKVRLSVAFFDDADATINYVVARLPSALKENL